MAACPIFCLSIKQNRCDSNSFLTKQGTYALSQCGVFMEEPPECLTDSVDLGPEGCSVHGEGFEPCLSFKLDVRESRTCWEEIRRSHLHESPNPMGQLGVVITLHHWSEVFLEEVNGQGGRTL